MDIKLVLMDILTEFCGGQMVGLHLRDGFAGQDMFVIPRPILARARQHPLIRSVYPTDIGWFPNATHHFRKRVDGARQDHLMLCVAGHGFATIEGTQVKLGAGELLIIPRNAGHTYWAADDDPWSIYWVHFLGDDADYYVDRIPQKGYPLPVEPGAQREAVRLFRYCLDALYDGYDTSTLIYAAQSVQHILSLLLFRNSALNIDSGRKRRRSVVDATTAYMLENLDKPLQLENFAGHAGLSVSHFSELFRSQTGQSPMAFFIHLKIRHACRMLDLSRETVKSIAFRTGYRDQYYFSRVFKKVMGISPGKYREIKKG